MKLLRKKDLDEIDELLWLAASAAKKLDASYLRGEIEPRAEFDSLIGARARLAEALRKLRS